MSKLQIEQVRNQFPALNRTYNGLPAVFFDGPGGSQVVQSSIDAIVNYMSKGGANLHGQFPTSKETEQHIKEAREIIADLLGAYSNEVAFGQNATSLAFSIARSLSREWSSGDEIVLSELDHPANIDSWLTAANDKGVKVRWLKVDKETLTLDLSDLDNKINENTKLVAVTLASNAIGTVPDIKKISKQTKKVGALLAVDAVHAAPHFLIDRDELNADIILCSAYKFFGPHIGIAVIRKKTFETLEPYKVKPAPNFTPDKLETGTQNFSAISAVKPAIEFIEKLGLGKTRRKRIEDGYRKIEEYENFLADTVREELSKMSKVQMFQTNEDVTNIKNTPTIAFRVDGISPVNFSKIMAEEYSIFVADGHFYATRLAERLDVLDNGGWIRIGMAPYNKIEEVESFLKAVKKIIT